jgi:hypothetical protein
MSAASDSSIFARYFDFDSNEVGVEDLIEHLLLLGQEAEMIGLNNSMACMAAGTLLKHLAPTGVNLLKTLCAADSDTWGEWLG